MRKGEKTVLKNIPSQAADADRDGQVSSDEFPTMIAIATAAQKRLGLPAPFQLAEEREKTFAKMDENGDGSIAFNEWLAFFLQVVEKKTFSIRKTIFNPLGNHCSSGSALNTPDLQQPSTKTLKTSDCWGRTN